MKKSLISIIPLIIFLSACNTKNENTSESNSEVTSLVENDSASENTSTKENDSSSEEESISEVESIESETPSEGSGSEEIFTEVSFTPDFAPSPVSSGYPDDQVINVNNYSFFVSEMVLNNGKYKTDTIQMKKGTSYLYNKTPLHGKLIITLLKNVTTAGDYTGYFNVYVGNNENPTSSLLEGTKNEDETTVTYTYLDAVKYSYFTIKNESDYATYTLSFTWSK